MCSQSDRWKARGTLSLEIQDKERLKEEEENYTVKSFAEIKQDKDQTSDTGFSNGEVTGDLVQTSQGSTGYRSCTKIGRRVGGFGEEMEVDTSSRNLALKEPNRVRGRVARKRLGVHRGVISFCSYLFKVNFILKYNIHTERVHVLTVQLTRHFHKGTHPYRIRKYNPD